MVVRYTQANCNFYDTSPGLFVKMDTFIVYSIENGFLGWGCWNFMYLAGFYETDFIVFPAFLTRVSKVGAVVLYREQSDSKSTRSKILDGIAMGFLFQQNLS